MAATPSVITISAETARRFILGRQGLWPARRWSGTAGTHHAMHEIEFLQLDPLRIVALSHDLVLHARVDGYAPADFHRLTYDDRAFFDWGGWLAVRPMNELPVWRVAMARNRDLPGMRDIVAAHPAEVDAMRTRLRSGELLTNRAITGGEDTPLHPYRGRRGTSQALYYLWRTGESMTFRRDGFERVYAASAAVAPPGLLHEASAGEADLAIMEKLVAFDGIGRPSMLARWLARPVARAEERAMLEALVDARRLSEVRVGGWRGASYVPTRDVDDLLEVHRGGVPRSWAPAPSEPGVTLLSPLDPVSARGRAKQVFGFDYTWEIYHRAADVRFGRFAMPILWGDALVGRADLRLVRTASTLVVNGVWFEEGHDHRAPAFKRALLAALHRLREFVGAEHLRLPETGLSA